MKVPNVDSQEVKKFDDMAQYWWDPEGPCQLLHWLNPLRLTFIQRYCALHGQQVIDVGCGGGILTEAIATLAHHTVGLDQATETLDVATQHAAQLSRPPHYVCSTVEEYATHFPASFDVLTCLEMLEHVPDPASTVQACAALVKPGGHLFFSTLNRTPKGFIVSILGAEYLLKKLPRGTHRYDRFIRPSELAHFSNQAGLRVQHISGVEYHPFQRRFSLSSDVSVNYLMHCRKE